MLVGRGSSRQAKGADRRGPHGLAALVHDSAVDGDGQATEKNQRGGRGRLMTAVVLVLVAVVVAGAMLVRSRDSSDSERVRTDPDAPSSVQVTTGELTGVDGLSQVVAVDHQIVGFSFPWGEHAAWWSSDRGQTWDPSTGLAGSVDGYRLIAAGSQLFAADDRFSTNESPALWLSGDGGRSFAPAVGLVAQGTATQVMTVIGAEDDLVAFGYRTRPSHRSWRWTSSDGGRTWTGAELDATAPKYIDSIVAVGGTMVAVVRPNSDTGRIPTGPGLVWSGDAGITWSPVMLPDWRGESTEDAISSLSVVNEHVVASSRRQTFMTENPGADWRLLGSAPPLPDEAGELPPAAETGAVQIFEVDGNHVVAKIGAFYNNDHEVGRLGWSDDGGASWQVADMGVRCAGFKADADLGRPVRLGGALVAAWNCSGEGDSGGHLLVSTDDGRTWTQQTETAALDTRVLSPVLVDGHVVALTATNIEKSTDGWIDMTLGE